MEITDCRLSIFKIGNRLPRLLRNIIANPVDEILDLAPKKSRVQNLTNLKLWKAVHVERRGGNFHSIWKSVGNMLFQKADVEDRMDVHRGREI